MNAPTIQITASSEDRKELDELLWRVLWKPLGLPRNARHEFKTGGESLELVAKANGQIIGGLVAVWTRDAEVELRHLAVKPDSQNEGTGQQLVANLFEIVRPRGCRRIHTIARNTSTGFFRKLGFRTAAGTTPEHPGFKKHGIVFELMERIFEPAGAGDALQRF
jgi:N-acetylglutamate synthase-like GNAT family acetyltransferase